jgi:hypothetical protein
MEKKKVNIYHEIPIIKLKTKKIKEAWFKTYDL